MSNLETATVLAAVTGSACEAAKEMWALKMREAERYSNLRYWVLAAAAAVLIVAIIAALITTEWSAAVVGGVGLVVNGAAFVAINNARNGAVADAGKWVAEIEKHCGADTVEGLKY